MPTTTTTSWTRAARAVAPNLTLPKRIQTQIKIPSEPSRMSSTACWMSWALITGPTVGGLAGTGDRAELRVGLDRRAIVAMVPFVGTTSGHAWPF